MDRIGVVKSSSFLNVSERHSGQVKKVPKKTLFLRDGY